MGSGGDDERNWRKNEMRGREEDAGCGNLGRRPRVPASINNLHLSTCHIIIELFC